MLASFIFSNPYGFSALIQHLFMVVSERGCGLPKDHRRRRMCDVLSPSEPSLLAPQSITIRSYRLANKDRTGGGSKKHDNIRVLFAAAAIQEKHLRPFLPPMKVADGSSSNARADCS